MTMALFFNYNHYNYITNYNIASMTSNFNDNILSLQLQHNLIEWQWHYFSITIITITSTITTLLQWHQISMTTSCQFNYNIIWLNDNDNIFQLQSLQLHLQSQQLLNDVYTSITTQFHYITTAIFPKCCWFVLQFLLQLCLFSFITIMPCVPSLQLCSVYPDVVQVFHIARPAMVAGAPCVIVWYVISRYAGGDRHGMVAGIPQDQSRTDNSRQTNHFEAGLSPGCHSA